MQHFWNIHGENYDEFTQKIRTSANRVIRKNVIYAEENSGDQYRKGPLLLIAEGAAMTRKKAYSLVKYYCNTHGVFYNYNDLDDIVDGFFGTTKEEIKEPVREQSNRTDFYAYQRRIENYKQTYRQQISSGGNPWTGYVARAA